VLRVEGFTAGLENKEIIAQLEKEFGKQNFKVNGYFLEFVSDQIPFLSHEPIWTPIGTYSCLSARFLDPNYVAASKLFSAFSDQPRKADRQDVRAVLDQGLVKIDKLCQIADELFVKYKFSGREDRFPEVYAFIKDELMSDYGAAKLEYELEE